MNEIAVFAKIARNREIKKITYPYRTMIYKKYPMNVFVLCCNKLTSIQY